MSDQKPETALAIAYESGFDAGIEQAARAVEKWFDAFMAAEHGEFESPAAIVRALKVCNDPR